MDHTEHPASRSTKLLVKAAITIVFILGITYISGDSLKEILFVLLYNDGSQILTISQSKEVFWYFLFITIAIIVFAIVDPDDVTCSKAQKDDKDVNLKG
jgi:hypothetical protein